MPHGCWGRGPWAQRRNDSRSRTRRPLTANHVLGLDPRSGRVGIEQNGQVLTTGSRTLRGRRREVRPAACGSSHIPLSAIQEGIFSTSLRPFQTLRGSDCHFCGISEQMSNSQPLGPFEAATVVGYTREGAHIPFAVFIGASGNTADLSLIPSLDVLRPNREVDGPPGSEVTFWGLWRPGWRPDTFPRADILDKSRYLLILAVSGNLAALILATRRFAPLVGAGCRLRGTRPVPLMYHATWPPITPFHPRPSAARAVICPCSSCCSPAAAAPP